MALRNLQETLGNVRRVVWSVRRRTEKAGPEKVRWKREIPQDSGKTKPICFTRSRNVSFQNAMRMSPSRNEEIEQHNTGNQQHVPFCCGRHNSTVRQVPDTYTAAILLLHAMHSSIWHGHARDNSPLRRTQSQTALAFMNRGRRVVGRKSDCGSGRG